MEEAVNGKEDEAPARVILERLGDLVRTFGVERRMEDEPAHHARLLDELAEGEGDGERR